MGPTIAILIWLERRARKLFLLGDKESHTDEMTKAVQDTDVAAAFAKTQKPIMQRAADIASEIDAIGLLLLGFGWSLVRYFPPPPLSWRVLTSKCERSSCCHSRFRRLPSEDTRTDLSSPCSWSVVSASSATPSTSSSTRRSRRCLVVCSTTRLSSLPFSSTYVLSPP